MFTRRNILAQALAQKEKLDSEEVESTPVNEILRPCDPASLEQLMADLQSSMTDEERADEDAVVKCLETEWDPSGAASRESKSKSSAGMSSNTTTAPGPAAIGSATASSSASKTQQRQSNKHVQLIHDTLKTLQAYDEHAEETLSYYRRARARMTGSILTHVRRSSTDATPSPSVSAPRAAAEGGATGAGRTAPSTAVGRGLGAASGAGVVGTGNTISTAGGAYDPSRDPRLRR